MKSDGMLADDDGDDEEPEPEPWEVAMEGGAPDPADGDFDPIDELEAEMDRRLDRKNTRGSPETLDELGRELREAERGSWWKDSRGEYDTSESPHGHARGTQTLDYHTGDEFRRDGEPTAGEATDRTHDEDIEEVIVGIDNALRTQFDRGRTEVLFAEIETAGGRPFMTYLALLFMAHRGSVRLQQDDLFGDLWVKDPSAMAGSRKRSRTESGPRLRPSLDGRRDGSERLTRKPDETFTFDAAVGRNSHSPRRSVGPSHGHVEGNALDALVRPRLHLVDYRSPHLSPAPPEVVVCGLGGRRDKLLAVVGQPRARGLPRRGGQRRLRVRRRDSLLVDVPSSPDVGESCCRERLADAVAEGHVGIDPV